jgi:pilus assembly protein FimV
VHKSKIKQISLAVCLALMPLSNYAAGLGKLNVNSGIGEPFIAEIELLSVTPEELSTLAASIASEEAYAQQGIPRLGIHGNIKIEIAKKSDGSPVLKLHSNQPVSDPYLDMLVQVDWATGRLQREYTVLLDPPGYKPEESVTLVPITLPSAGNSNAVTVQSNGTQISAVDSTQPPSKKTKKLKKAIAQPVVQDSAPVESTGEQELTTKRGDTLSAVARELQVEGVSLDQMLVGLYENNKAAFTSGNMNRLKVGQIIKVPSKDVLTGITTQEAKKSVKIHSENWNAYRNGLAGKVAAEPLMAEPEQKQSSSGKIATAEDKAAPIKAGPQDVVKLSAGEKDAKKGTVNSAEAKIIALQEETTAREKALKEASDRTAVLEKQISDMQKLIALKSQSMAELQKNAEAAANKSEAKVESAVVNKPEETPKVETTAPVAAEEKPIEVKPVETKVVKPEVKKSVVQPPVAAQAPAQEQQGFISNLMSSIDLTVIGGASVIALLGAGWMYLRNKRRKDLDSFERGILTSGGLRANTVFGNTTGNASMSDTSFLTDFAQSADGNMIDTNDVDPIAEAEVYMAYGRDAQAEEILKDAITKEPKRYELHLKLLEMYAARKDTSAFEAIAGELYTTLGAADPTWVKVAALGAEMEPENPLYNLDNSNNASSTPKLETADFSDVSVASRDDLDFTLNDGIANDQPVVEDANSAVIQSFAAAPNVESDIEFDLGTIDEVANETKESKNVDDILVQADSSSDNSMDFDLGDFDTGNESISATEELDISEVATSKPVEELPPTDFEVDFNIPTKSVQNDIEQEKPFASNVIEEISFDLDSAAEEPIKAIVEPVEIAASEINFDLPNIEKREASTNANGLEANAFDLSTIDLNISDAESELPVEKKLAKKADKAVDVSPVVDATESQDVNIKLDLVAAYIDMDDKEGARELLEEVLKEGSAQQQVRAQQLLDGLA